MKRIWRYLSPILSLLFIGSAVLIPFHSAMASVTEVISVTDTTGTSRTNIPVLVNINVSDLISSGNITNVFDFDVQDSSGNSIKFMPIEDKLAIVCPSLGAYGTTNLYLKLGTPSGLSHFPIIVGSDGYITTSDNANLEPGINFNVALSGYFNTSTGVSKNIFRKDDSITDYISNNEESTANITGETSGNITSITATGITSNIHTISTSSDGTALRLTVDGVPNTTAYVTGSNNFTATPYGLEGADTTYISAHDGAYSTSTNYVGQWNLYGSYYYIGRQSIGFDTSVLPDTSDVISANMTITPSNKTITVNNFNEAIVSGSGCDGSTADYQTLLSATTDFGHYNTADMTDGVPFTIPLNNTGLLTIEKSGLTWFGLRSVNDINSSFIPGTDENQKVANSGDVSLDVTYGIRAKDSANNWYWMENNVMPYADNISISVNGVETLHYSPTNLIQSSILPDTSGYGNNGVITWGTNNGLTVSLSVTVTVVETLPATNVTTTSATLNGNLEDMGGGTSINVLFQYGISTAYGSTTPLQAKTTTGQFQADITGLSVNVEYHFRAVAVSSNTTYYGTDLTFTPAETGGVLQMGNGDGRVFFNYITKGDMLFTAEIVNTYLPYFQKQSPKEYFTIQLIDTDNTTVLAATPEQDWGDKPVSIYLNPTQALTITPRAAYSIRVQATFADNVSAQYTLKPSDWKGYDLTKLDSWCLDVAHNMQLFYSGAGYTTILTDRKEVITDAVGGYFTTGIPAIGQVRPNLFTTSQQNPAFNAGISQLPTDNTSAYVYYVGPSIAADAAVLSTPLGVTARDALSGILIVGMLLIVGGGVAAMGGFGALGLFLISVPILWIGTYFKIIGVQWMMILVIIFAFFAIRQFFIKTT